MCGIAGYYGAGDRALLARMGERVAHRGPDAAGYFVDSAVGLTHRRLAIIDPNPIANQPLPGCTDAVQVACNGEIYNHQKLRAPLSSAHAFRSDSDSEVITHLYEEHGADAFARLRGMFAIALYDATRQQLFLARDHFGKKPLYYGMCGSTFVFGSELKVFFEYPDFKKDIDRDALARYFAYDYIPTPHTIFSGIRKLRPGHYLVYDGTRMQEVPFWTLSVGEEKTTMPYDEARDMLDTLLEAAVERRLMSDVPLGVLLSGGIDSSTIAYYAQRCAARAGNEPIHTFSIGFAEQSFDESAHARTVAAALGTTHHERILTGREAVNLVPQIARQFDEPFADPSAVPTYLLAAFARERITVALGGDGADELFFGYDTFRAERYAQAYQKLPDWFRTRMAQITRALPVSHANMSFDFKVQRFAAGFEGPARYRHQRWLGAFTPEELRLLLVEPEAIASPERVYADIDAYRQVESSDEPLDLLTHQYLRLYLMDGVLAKLDRASMAHAFEVRAPFLDLALARFVLGLPHVYRMRGSTSKYILKDLMRGRLPQSVLARPKKGFGMPVAAWLAGALRPLVCEQLDPDLLKRQGLFEPGYVSRLVREHFDRRANHGKKLWALVMFQLWYNSYLQ